jgi:hypothetical protein
MAVLAVLALMPIMILVVQVGALLGTGHIRSSYGSRAISAEGGVRSSVSGRGVGAPYDRVVVPTVIAWRSSCEVK